MKDGPKISDEHFTTILKEHLDDRFEEVFALFALFKTHHSFEFTELFCKANSYGKVGLVIRAFNTLLGDTSEELNLNQTEMIERIRKEVLKLETKITYDPESLSADPDTVSIVTDS